MIRLLSVATPHRIRRLALFWAAPESCLKEQAIYRRTGRAGRSVGVEIPQQTGSGFPDVCRINTGPAPDRMGRIRHKRTTESGISYPYQFYE
jgi:hypothetical protein